VKLTKGLLNVTLIDVEGSPPVAVETAPVYVSSKRAAECTYLDAYTGRNTYFNIFHDLPPFNSARSTGPKLTSTVPKADQPPILVCTLRLRCISPNWRILRLRKSRPWDGES